MNANLMPTARQPHDLHPSLPRSSPSPCPPPACLSFDGSQVSADRIELLKALPIFPVHEGIDPAMAGEGRKTGPRSALTSLSGRTSGLMLAPKDSKLALLDATFALEMSEQDTQLLEALEVKRMERGLFFRKHVLPRWAEQDPPSGKC